MIRKLLKLALVCVLWGNVSSGFADVQLNAPEGLRSVGYAQNVSGGLDYLADGDILGIHSVYGAPGFLYRFDANRDGNPVTPTTLYSWSSDVFGSFVKVSPSGAFALFGVTSIDPAGLNAILKIDLLSGTVSPVVTIAGNFDLVFVSEHEILVSANDYSQYPSPNQIVYYDLVAGGSPRVIAEFMDVPSGPLARNSQGDLYYVRGTFAFPPPPASYSLLKFTSAQVVAAIAGSLVLNEAASEQLTQLDSGYGLVVNDARAPRDELYISDLGGRVTRYVLGESFPTNFVTTNDSGGSFSGLALFKPHQKFAPHLATRAKLGSSYAVNYLDYFFTEITAEDHDRDGRPDDIIDGVCSSDTDDCVNEKLRPRACVGANGFLGQINIASIINQSANPLSFTLEYFDQAGFLRQRVENVAIAAHLKSDFIINDLGLQRDTVGTLCVSARVGTVDAPAGSWSGGMALYKPNARPDAPPSWGQSFDFALYYPFENPRYGNSAAPLNTFRLGMDTRDSVANWISIADAGADGVPLAGTLSYYDQAGSVVFTEHVSIPDRGRRDFPGHVRLTNSALGDAIGTAEFVPDRVNNQQLPYYLTVTRYFYDCGGVFCNNFLSAFNIPSRPAAQSPVIGGVATNNGEISIVELSNVANEQLTTNFSVFSTAGNNLGSINASVPQRGTQHFIMNRVGQSGFLASGEVGSASVQAPVTGLGAARSMFYKLGATGRLEYGYAAALRGAIDGDESTQFNTFIDHVNSVELFNTSPGAQNLEVQFVDFQGTILDSRALSIPAFGGTRFDALTLPVNTLGTVRVVGSSGPLSVRNYTFRKDEYVLPFVGVSETGF